MRGQAVGPDAGGPALVAQVLEQTLGLRIDHWIRIEIDDVQAFVDQLGGITVHLDCPFNEPVINLDTGQWEYLTVPAGDVRMDGETVYWFVRLRLLEGDAGRTSRQRQLLLALREQVINTRSLQNLPQVIDEFHSMFSTDMTAAQLLDLGRVGLSLPPADIHSGGLSDGGLQLFRTPHGIDVLRIADPTRGTEVGERVVEQRSSGRRGKHAAGQMYGTLEGTVGVYCQTIRRGPKRVEVDESSEMMGDWLPHFINRNRDTAKGDVIGAEVGEDAWVGWRSASTSSK